jgi:hypothetical protein
MFRSFLRRRITKIYYTEINSIEYYYFILFFIIIIIIK